MNLLRDRDGRPRVRALFDADAWPRPFFTYENDKEADWRFVAFGVKPRMDGYLFGLEIDLGSPTK